jgi:hypothetical protein
MTHSQDLGLRQNRHWIERAKPAGFEAIDLGFSWLHLTW